MALFRRALISTIGAVFLLIGLIAVVPAGVASADPPPQAQNDGNGNSDSPGNDNNSDNRNDGAQGDRGGDGNGSSAGNSAEGQSSGAGQGSGSGSGQGSGGQDSGGGATRGSSDSNPDGGGLDKPDCETAAEGGQGPAPREGNNGCGNEAEPKSVRDDDNNGNCGGGQQKDKDDAQVAPAGGASVAGAAASGAWTGDSATLAGEVVVAGVEAARVEAAQVRAAAARTRLSFHDNAAVLGVSVERDSAPEALLGSEELELAREAGSSRSGSRSLLALTGMSLLALLAGGLFLLGLGRLFRNVESDVA